jgi:hypothetical protein
MLAAPPAQPPLMQAPPLPPPQHIHVTGTIDTRRAGRYWEAAGFVLVVAGMLTTCGNVPVGAGLAFVGLVVFIIGRFK